MTAPPRLDRRRLLVLGVGLLVAGVTLLGVGLTVLALNRAGSGGKAGPPTISTSALVSAARPTLGSPEPTWTSSASPLPAPTPTPTAPAPSVPAATQTRTKVDAYRGLGSWIDIYDEGAWKDPAATVADMAGHGVRTIYIETGNSRSKGVLFKPVQMQQFITEAHAHGLKIVAWYLPDMTDLNKDFTRVTAAIQLRTSAGQGFDSFALDIESGAVKTQQARNRALMTLSRQIRDSVGPSYSLGAITPSPVGLSRKRSYWSRFPYSELAGIYDVFLPMGYYTYHGKGAALAYADTVGNVRIIRAQPGCSATPIHLIGGESEKSSTAEVKAFVRGTQETACIGASLYGWAGTKAAAWRELATVGSGTP
jgi:hypothetical protein